MTPKQRIHLMAELWPQACEAQGWRREDNELRYDIFAQVLGRIPRHAQTLAAGHHISANDFDNSDFDRVKAHLKFLADNIAGAIETDHPDLGERRRYLWLIRNDLHRLMEALGVPFNPYLTAILRAEHHAQDLDLLDTPAIYRLVLTLTARIDSKRRAKGWTKHDLYHAAALRCPPGCRQCAAAVPPCESVSVHESPCQSVSAADQSF